VVTDEFELESGHCVFSVLDLSAMNTLPIDKFDTAGAATPRRPLAALLLG
jgi:hypothetical protein